MYRRALFTACWLLVLPAATARADLLGAPTAFGVGAAPFALAVTDFNSDGDPDLAVVNSDANSISVLLGGPGGGFGTAVTTAVGEPVGIAAADFNGDGRADLAIGDDVSDQVVVLLGQGGGSFGPPLVRSLSGSPRWLATGDFNADGRPDLAVAVGSTVAILLDGPGGLGAPTPFSLGASPSRIAVGDFDGDGRQDLAASDLVGQVDVLRGRGDGSFEAPTAFPVGRQPFGLAVADLNGDGDPDLVVPNSASNDVSVLLGTAGAGFAPQMRFPAGSEPDSAAVADFDGDGVPDVVLADVNGVAVLPGMGGGALGAPVVFPAGTGPEVVVTADFDADGRPDVATSDHAASDVSVLHGAAVAGASTTPDNLAFGDQTEGTTSAQQVIAAISTGDRALRPLSVVKAGPAAADFVVAQDGCTGAVVPAGRTCAVQVRFDPTGVGLKRATLRIVTNGGTFDAALTGTGVAPPLASPAPAGPAGPAGSPGPRGPAGPAGPAAGERDLLFAVFGADSYRARRGRRVAIRLVTTVRSLVTVRVRRGARVVRTFAAGRRRLALRAPRRRGRYRLTLTAVAGAQRASDTATLVVR